jgi:hypothetical protein
MSLLQEMQHFGLADCESNRHLIHKERRIKRLIATILPVFNDHQEIEGDYDLVMNAERAEKSAYFLHWLEIWSDIGRRGELANLIKELV